MATCSKRRPFGQMVIGGAPGPYSPRNPHRHARRTSTRPSMPLTQSPRSSEGNGTAAASRTASAICLATATLTGVADMKLEPLGTRVIGPFYGRQRARASVGNSSGLELDSDARPARRDSRHPAASIAPPATTDLTGEYGTASRARNNGTPVTALPRAEHRHSHRRRWCPGTRSPVASASASRGDWAGARLG
jgi:hypothetical protein